MNPQDKLTSPDITLLMEALDAWHDRHTSQLLLKVFLQATATGKPTGPLLEAAHKEAQQKMQAEEEMVVLLKAKLIRLRWDAPLSHEPQLVESSSRPKVG